MPVSTGYVLFVAGLSASLVGIVRRIAVAHGVIDRPTHRSSHRTPTPRGGGLGVTVAIVIAFVGLDAPMGDPAVLAGIVGCVAVAAVGWFDDRRGLSIRIRLIVHALSGIAVATLSLGSAVPAALTIAVFVWWTFWTISSINLVNFMDGINGLVASQVAVFAASLTLFGQESSIASRYPAAIAAACLGFLPWNFPRARIFLGDVGSGALGFLVPFAALLVMREGDINLIQAHLPLLPLFGDATVTIVRRWSRGETLTQPHRSHLYQRLANGGWGHTKVTLLFASASVVGAIVAHVERRGSSQLLIGLYVLALIVLGASLERRLHPAALRIAGE